MHRPSPRTSHRPLARAAAIVAAAGAAVLLTALPASAHVTVDPSEATQGGYATLTFKVPNEKDQASTTKLEVVTPTDAPLASVSTQPVPGWTVQVTKGKLAKPVKTDDGEITEGVTRITWTAKSPADAFGPGQFQLFAISAGPLPETASLEFRVLQTYSDGEIVRWIDKTVAGQEEPAHPAPVVTLVKAAEGEDHHGAAATDAPSATGEHEDDSDGNGVAIGLGIAGLVAGLAGLALGAVALRRSAASR